MDTIVREIAKLTKFDFNFKPEEIPITKIRFSVPRSVEGLAGLLGSDFKFLWASPTGREILVLGPKPELVIGEVSIFFSDNTDFSPSELSCKVYGVTSKLQVVTIFLYRQVKERLKLAKETGLEFPSEDTDSGDFIFPGGERKEIILNGASTYSSIIEG